MGAMIANRSEAIRLTFAMRLQRVFGSIQLASVTLRQQRLVSLIPLGFLCTSAPRVSAALKVEPLATDGRFGVATPV